MNTYSIKAKKDLFDAVGVKCFTKDQTYTYEAYNPIRVQSGLMNVHVKNDQGVQHRISTWYKEFTLVKPGQ
jgi:hypothetical protein